MSVWQPVSGCGPWCRDDVAETVGPVRRVGRMIALFAVLLSGLVLVPLRRGAAAPQLARGILAALGVRLRRSGPAPRPGSLLVANHVSWLDTVVLLATQPVSLVAKREVRGWPGIGGVAAVSGAIFVDRTSPRALPGTVAEVAAALRSGRTVAAFPEGTTFCGTDRGRFRPALFQAAVDAGAPVVPMSISYSSTLAAFVGDDSLWSSVTRVAAVRELTVTVSASPALIPVDGADRRILARAAQASAGLTAAGLGLAA